MTERNYNFTGKSDFFDWCNMHHNPEEIISKADVFLGNAQVKLNTPEDLIPYYTNLVASAGCSKDHQNINLSAESFLDSEEKEFLAHKIYSAIKWARKAKKNKVNFDFDFVKSQKDYYSEINSSIWKAIIDVISKNQDIIKIHLSSDYREAIIDIVHNMIPKYFRTIHDYSHTRRREDFVRYASENGYKAFIYGVNEGKYHPIIWSMCVQIRDFNEMIKKYGED